MRTDIDAELVVGFVFDAHEIVDRFRETTTNGRSHTEPRYDPRTGERVDDVVVVDEEPGEVVRLPGSTETHQIDEDGVMPDAFFDELCAKAQGWGTTEYDEYAGGTRVALCLPRSLGDPLELMSIDHDMFDELDALRLRLFGLGLSPTDPVVTVFLNRW